MRTPVPFAPDNGPEAGSAEVLAAPLPSAALCTARDIYRELMQAAYAELRERADAGEEAVRRWLERFITLGEQLGVPPTGRLEAAEAPGEARAVAARVAESFARRHTPSATYRLQFNRGFTFRDAR